ncbi:MAG: carboxypeptidase regulatory-like domain-containing protein [Bacteroidota bacterium]
MAKKTTYKLLTLLLLIAAPYFGFGQTVQLLIQNADKYAELNQHPEAIKIYKAVLEDMDPNNISAQYKIAESYRAIKDYEMAEGYYQKVKRRNDGRFLLAGFYYALMRKLNGDYNEALEEFEAFMALLKEREQHEDDRFRYYYEQARIEREGSLIALNEISITQPEHQFSILPSPVNSELMDSAPAIYLNDSTLVVTTGRGKSRGTAFGEPWNNLFRYSKVGDKWEQIKDRDGWDIVNDNFEDAAGVFNTEKNKLYFTRCEPVGDNEIPCKVYVSKLIGGEWSEPQELNFNINSRGSNSRQAFITYSGDSLFFCSDRDGGYGEYDIYLSTKYGDENWGPPQNLGSQINTPFTESSPFYDHIDQSLFFSSTGHRGFGGYDIYMAHGTSFDKAEIYNVGKPFNSNGDDLFWFLGKNKGYLSSNRDGGAGKMDIYGFIVSTENEIVTEIETDESIAGRNSLFSDDYDFDSDNDAMLSEIISHLMAAKVSDVEMALTSDQLSFYNSLSKDDQERIDRIVGARVRNLSQNDLNAIRDEDEFFYSSMQSDDKRHLDNLISAYVREDGLGLSVSVEQEDNDFYENLAVEDKEKVDMIIATRIKQAQDYHYPSADYDQLDEQSKASVNSLSGKVIAQKKNFESMSLAFNENLFLRNNQENKDLINNSIKEKIYNLSEDPQFQLKEEDRIFYQNLDSKQLEGLQNIASAIILNDVDKLGDKFAKEDLAVYNSFSGNQKLQLDRILSKIINNSVKADLYLGEVNFEKSEVAAAKVDRDIEAAFTVLKSSKQPLFNALSENNHRAIKRFISVSEPWINSPGNIYLPNSEVSEPIAYVDRGPMIAEVRAGITSKYGTTGSSRSNNASEPGTGTGSDVTASAISNTNISLFENLSEAEKAAVSRSIAANLVSTAYRDDPSLAISDNSAYAVLNAQQKSFIQVLTKRLSGSPLTANEKLLLSSAESYYEHLPETEKAIWSRVIAKEALKANRNGNEYTITAQDEAVLVAFTTYEKSAVENIQNSMLNQQRLLLGGVTIYSQFDLNKQRVGQIPANIVDNFSQINVSGRLLNTTNNTPLSGTILNLVSNNGVVIGQVTTKADGGFLFTNTPNTDYYFELADPSIDKTKVYLSEPNVKGTGPASQNTFRPGDPINQEDIKYYSSLNAEQKRAIDLSIAASMLSDIYSKSPDQALSDQAFYKTLSDKEKSYISILAKELRGETIVESEYLLKATADSYYAHLIPVEHPYWSRLIAIEALKDYRNNNAFSVSDEIQSIINSLSYSEKNSYERIKLSRSLNEPMFSNQLNANPKLLASIPENAAGNKDAMIVSGMVAEVKTNIPAADQSLALLDESNSSVSTTKTDVNGKFAFNEVSTGNYQVTNSSESLADNLYIDNLALKDKQGETLVASSGSSKAPGSAGLESNDISFYNNLNTSTRKAFDSSIATELLNEAYEKTPTQTTSDQQTFNSTNQNIKGYIQILAQDLNGANIPANQLGNLAVAYSYYRQLAGNEQQEFGRMVTQQAFVNSKSGNQYVPSPADLQIINNLSAYEKGVYNRIKETRRITGPLTDGAVAMDDSDDILMSIPPTAGNAGSMLEVSGRLGKKDSNEPAASVSITLSDNNGNIVSRTTSDSNGQFEFDRVNNGNYVIKVSKTSNSGLPANIYVSDINFKEVATDNILAANEKSLDLTPSQLSASTIGIYQNLSRTDQKTVDRLIAFEYLTQAYKNDPNLKKADQQALKDLNSQEEKYMKILAMDLNGQELSKAEQSFLSSAFSYYYNVAPSRKAVINRIVSDMVFSENMQGNNYRLAGGDVSFRNGMNASTSSAVDNIKTFRFNNERILCENLEVESRDMGEHPIVLNIPGYTNQQFGRLNITGKLISTQTGNPVSTKALRVVDNNGNMIARTFSGSDGTFKFSEIRSGNYHIELEQAYSARTQNESYFVKDLEITGTEGSKYAYQQSFNIHFNFNGTELRPEAKQALFDVIELAENQEITLELRAHTDGIGDVKYNDELSGKRGNETVDFLKRYGIRSDQISLLSLGKNDPVASNNDEYGRQFNRRVEIIIKSHSPINYQPPTVYLIRPKATLYSIAKNFNLTMEEIMKLNGLEQASLDAYKPLRILNPMNYKPNLDMLVELNASVSTSNSFKYTVKNPGETVTSIAEKFNLPEELVWEMNNLTSPSLKQGQTLNIYVRY